MVYDPNFEFGNFKNHIEKWRGHFTAYNKETSPNNEKNQKVYEKYRQVRDFPFLSVFYDWAYTWNVITMSSTLLRLCVMLYNLI